MLSLLIFAACTDRDPGTVIVLDTGDYDDYGDDSGDGSTVGSAREDDDNDGYSERDGDCDDGQPAINPLATDLVGDGVDQNCDGTDGFDSDGDGHADLTSGGDDCDDDDAYTFPGAIEIWYDDKDQGCLGVEWDGDGDQDGDGFEATEVNDGEDGGDCIDTNAAVFPGTVEDNSNALDDNCNGLTDAFGVRVVWTPDDEMVAAFTVSDDYNAMAITMISRAGDLDASGVLEQVTLSNTSEASYTIPLFTGGTEFEDEFTSLTYIYTSGSDIASTGSNCVVWGPRADEVIDWGAEYGIDCTDITDVAEQSEDRTTWAWDGLYE